MRNPKIASEPADTVNPASSAAPPKAPDTFTPLTENWKPPISDELEYITSKVESVAEPSEMILSKQLVLSPLHTPQSSYSPTQSSILSQTASPSSSLHGRSTHPPVSKLIA